jgi:hypothetical protein
MDFSNFIRDKSQLADGAGFDPVWIPSFLKDFQKSLVEWSIKNGRAALFEDCGLGKTVQQLVWAENVVRKTNGKVLILTPLSVSDQTIEEAEKFGIKAIRSRDGIFASTDKIIVTNYEQLHRFASSDFVGVVCDESSILKNVKGETKREVTIFMRKLPYRLLCTATASPNDYIELGTSSEALGYLGYIDMLKKFFKADGDTYAIGGGAGSRTRFSGSQSFGGKVRFKGHSQIEFWRWVCSWARAIRKPGDLGYSNDGYDLPPLTESLHIVENESVMDGYLLPVPAVGLKEQREARTTTVQERCELAADIIAKRDTTSVAWCHTNNESNLLSSLIRNSVELTGSEKDEVKEEKLRAFRAGQIKVLVTKPTLAGFGHNWQHCDHQTVFPSHSFEQYYQCVRRSWRFGQTKPVNIDIITTQADEQVLKNLQRKTSLAEQGFAKMVELMADFSRHERIDYHPTHVGRLPAWLTQPEKTQ